MKIAIIYGSTGGNTQDVAKRIAAQLSGNDVQLFDVATVKAELFDEYQNLIFGTSTTGIGGYIVTGKQIGRAHV